MLEVILRGALVAAEVVLEWVLCYLFYFCGWLVLRALSLGRHPRAALLADDPLAPGRRWICALGGVVLVGIPLTLLVILYG